MSRSLTESTVEDAALAWLEAIGWQTAHRPDIAPSTPASERRDYAEVCPPSTFRDTLLPKLISGELRVKDAERFLEGVS